jgi:hypothetical protein
MLLDFSQKRYCQVPIGNFIGSIIKVVLPSIKLVYQNSICFCQAATMALYDELPKADFVLDANDVMKYGTVALDHCISDRCSRYHNLEEIVYESAFPFIARLRWCAARTLATHS